MKFTNSSGSIEANSEESTSRVSLYCSTLLSALSLYLAMRSNTSSCEAISSLSFIPAYMVPSNKLLSISGVFCASILTIFAFFFGGCIVLAIFNHCGYIIKSSFKHKLSSLFDEQPMSFVVV